MGSLDSVLGRGRAAVKTAAAPVTSRADNIYADARSSAVATADVIAPNGGSAAVAAGVLGFAAVGVLVALRIIFKGAVS